MREDFAGGLQLPLLWQGAVLEVEAFNMVMALILMAKYDGEALLDDQSSEKVLVDSYVKNK